MLFLGFKLVQDFFPLQYDPSTAAPAQASKQTSQPKGIFGYDRCVAKHGSLAIQLASAGCQGMSKPYKHPAESWEEANWQLLNGSFPGSSEPVDGLQP